MLTRVKGTRLTRFPQWGTSCLTSRRRTQLVLAHPSQASSLFTTCQTVTVLRLPVMANIRSPMAESRSIRHTSTIFVPLFKNTRTYTPFLSLVGQKALRDKQSGTNSNTEPDSLANLVTNMAVSKCANAHDAYLECTNYAVTQLNLDNVAMYLDAGE